MDKNNLYNYKATVTKVVDGDTIDVLIDLGFNVIMKERIRLLGIDAPESRTKDLAEKEKGLASTKYLRERLDQCNNEIIIKTQLDKKGKFGRILGIIYDKDENINLEMIAKGHAVQYK